MRYIFTLKSALIILLVMFCCTMKAETVNYTTDDGFAYSLDTETQEASLNKYNGDATDVVIPESITYENKIYKVTSLGNECFRSCYSLTSIEIPSSVTSLESQCFSYCTSLASIEIPSSVTKLGDWCFYNCSSLTSIEIPSSVTSLGDYCFQDCTSLTSIEIPSSVTSLGDDCFYKCSSLETVICKTEKVIEETSLFNGTYISSATLYVPKELLATYQTTSPWNGFGTILPLLSLPDITIYLGVKSKISANGVPEYAESKTLKWTSSNPDVANVDANGNVTALAIGNTIITATATDGSGVSANCQVTVIMPDFGDSNANGTVNIADAVNTANNAVGNEVENFCFAAADVNADGEVTVADASGTVTIILAQPVQESRYDARSLSALRPDGADCLTVSDYSAAAGETTTIGISLDNSIDYVALQADIVMPEGLTLQSVVGGIRAAGHTLTTRQIDSRRVRVVLFNLGNSAFAANRESLLELKVRIEDINAGDIIIENIIASDASANEYRLVSTGGHNGMVTEMDMIPSENVRVETADGFINVYNATGSAVTIYGTDGRVLARFVAKSAAERWQAASGVYVVAVGRSVTKVAVK